VGTVSTEVGSSAGIAAAFLGSAIDQGQANIQISVEDVEDVDALVAEVREEAEAYFGAEVVTVSSGSLSSSAFGGFALVASGDYEDLASFNDQAIETLNQVEGLANSSSNLADESTFLRVDGQPAVRFTGELETRDTLGVTQAAKEALLEVAPGGVTISEGFESQQQTEGFSQAIFAIGISVVVVYFVLVAVFRSFIHPFTILFSLPLAVIGAAVALWLADSIVGLSSLVGIMMLVGIVVTNAIVLIDRVQNNRRKRDMGIKDALLEGGRTRIRPILMTAIAAILALVPLAIGLSEGAIIASDLAIVVIGGLTTSTLLTLVVVPVMYSLLDRFDRRNRKLDEQQGETADEDGSDEEAHAEVGPVQVEDVPVPETTPADLEVVPDGGEDSTETGEADVSEGESDLPIDDETPGNDQTVKDE
jgi:multidrug efflux pump subunit AcrB